MPHGYQTQNLNAAGTGADYWLQKVEMLSEEIQKQIRMRVNRIVELQRKRMLFDTPDTRHAITAAKAELFDYLKEL